MGIGFEPRLYLTFFRKEKKRFSADFGSSYESQPRQPAVTLTKQDFFGVEILYTNGLRLHSTFNS